MSGNFATAIAFAVFLLSSWQALALEKYYRMPCEYYGWDATTADAALDQFVKTMNYIRNNAGNPKMVFNDTLYEAAEMHVKGMSEMNFTGEIFPNDTDSQGRNSSQRLDAIGLSYFACTESYGITPPEKLGYYMWSYNYTFLYLNNSYATDYAIAQKDNYYAMYICDLGD